MGKKSRLFVIFAVASMITTTVFAGLSIAVAPLLIRPSVPLAVQGIGVATTVLITIGAGVWWILKKLHPTYSRQAVRTAAIVFGVLTPVSMAIGLPLAMIPGAYADLALGSPFGFVGAFLGVIVVTTLLTSVPCVFTLLNARRREAAHQAE